MNANRGDVRALGAVVTRDLFFEMVRLVLRRPRMSLAAIKALSDRWRPVHSCLVTDRSERLAASQNDSLATPLSKRAEKAMVEFVDWVAEFYPHLYSEPALRARYSRGCRRVIASFALGAVLACFASPNIPIIADLTLVLFAIASGNVLITLELRRTHLLVKQISRSSGLRKHAPDSDMSKNY